MRNDIPFVEIISEREERLLALENRCDPPISA